MHRFADLLKTVPSQPGIDLRGGVKGKIPKGLAGENLPQIHRDQHFDGLSPALTGHLLLLHILQRLHHGGAEEFRQGHMVFMGLLKRRRHRQLETGQVQKSIFLRSTCKMPGVAFLPAGADSSGIFLEAVLYFRRRRFLLPAKDTLLRRNVDAVLLLQVFRHQGFQENQGAVSVGQGVEYLHCDPLFVGDDPQSALPGLLPGHSGQREAVLLPDGRYAGNLLQIIPEYTLP